MGFSFDPMNVLAIASLLLAASCRSLDESADLRVEIRQQFGVNGSVCVVIRNNDFVGLVEGLGAQGEVNSCRWIRLNVEDEPLVETFVSTSKGNGDYILFKSHRYGGLEALINTFAVDNHADTRVFRGGQLNVEYRDLDGDGYEDVHLSGTVDIYDEKGD